MSNNSSVMSVHLRRSISRAEINEEKPVPGIKVAKSGRQKLSLSIQWRRSSWARSDLVNSMLSSAFEGLSDHCLARHSDPFCQLIESIDSAVFSIAGIMRFCRSLSN